MEAELARSRPSSRIETEQMVRRNYKEKLQ
jgi:hypothetical protein